ncbi:hypothetical protein GCM10018952_33430 [Streptosporangium vulgare]
MVRAAVPATHRDAARGVAVLIVRRSIVLVIVLVVRRDVAPGLAVLVVRRGVSGGACGDDFGALGVAGIGRVPSRFEGHVGPPARALADTVPAPVRGQLMTITASNHGVDSDDSGLRSFSTPSR